MPGVISRDGMVMVMPEFSEAAKEAMVQAIAGAMVRLNRGIIEDAVAKYLEEKDGASGD